MRRGTGAGSDAFGCAATTCPDAYYAAIALEQEATVVTAYRGFARFGVRTLDPTAV